MNMHMKPTSIEKAEFVTITPDAARELLEYNSNNRAISRITLDRYIRDLNNGEWSVTGEAIKFSKSGRLLDGQHRLMACVKTGKSFRTLVVTGLDDTAMDNMDSGKKRDAGDTLKVNGYQNSHLLAAVIGQILDLRDRSFRNRARSKSEITNFVATYDQVQKSTKKVCHFNGPIPRPLAGAIHFIATEFLDEGPAVDRFIETLHTGYPLLGRGDPALLLRERVNSDQKKNGGKNPLRRDDVRIATIHSWNLYRRSKTLKKFIIPDEAEIDGLTPDHWRNEAR
ncbi:MAG: hypothetical protein CTY28_14545 [Hyphomicrobium sp.]|nr:MAG: hypothetical protein CTY28_14545 [Hyphomicrobium sp.]